MGEREGERGWVGYQVSGMVVRRERVGRGACCGGWLVCDLWQGWVVSRRFGV